MAISRAAGPEDTRHSGSTPRHGYTRDNKGQLRRGNRVPSGRASACLAPSQTMPWTPGVPQPARFRGGLDESNLRNGCAQALEDVAVDAASRLADAVVAGEGEEIEEAPPFGAADCFCDGVRGVGEDADAYALVSQEADEAEGGFICIGHT